MNFYPETQIVEIKVPFVTPGGAAISPTNITARLYDGEDVLLADFGSVPFDGAGVEASVVIVGSLNTLQGEDLEEIRRLEVMVSHAGGLFTLRHVWAIEAEQSLQIMRNSFMTHETALLSARSFVNLNAFTGSTPDRQKAALIEAYRRICNLSLAYRVVEEDQRTESTFRIPSMMWSEVSADAFQTQFPRHFRQALRAAQLAEADDLLQGNVVTRKQQQGIASETIGESSMTFQRGFSKWGSFSVGATALAHLSGYIDRSVHIGRA